MSTPQKISDLATAPQVVQPKLRYNKDEVPGELVEKKCITCGVSQKLPQNYVNCLQCNLQNLTIRAERHRLAQKALRERKKNATPVVTPVQQQQQAVEQPEQLCEMCNDVAVTRPNHYCESCKEARAVQRLKENADRKREEYALKKSFRLKSVVDDLQQIITSFETKDMERIKSYPREKIMRAVHLYMDNLSDDELYSALMDFFTYEDESDGAGSVAENEENQ